MLLSPRHEVKREFSGRHRNMALLTVVQLEQDSGVSRYTWRAWIRAGKLPVVRLGRLVRVAEEDYRRLLEECRAQGRPIGADPRAVSDLERRAVSAVDS